MTDPTLARPGCLTLACADLDARPLFWTDPDRSRHGYEPQAAECVAKAMGLRVHWQFLRWAQFPPALERGEVDAIWCGSAITEERRRVFDYSLPYAVFDEAVLIRRGEPIRGPADLAGRRVGAIAASTNMRLAERWPAGERVGFDGSSEDVFAEMVQALREGRIDALIDDEPAFGGLAADPRYEVAWVEPTRNAWGAAMRKGSEALRAALDEALVRVIADGSLATVWSRWFPDNAFPLPAETR